MMVLSKGDICLINFNLAKNIIKDTSQREIVYFGYKRVRDYAKCTV
jgi:hypothetical protein